MPDIAPPQDSPVIASYISDVFANSRLGRGVRDAINNAAIAQVSVLDRPTDVELIGIGVALANAPSGSLIWRAASSANDQVLYFIAPDESTVVNNLSALTASYSTSNIDWVDLGAIFASASFVAFQGQQAVDAWFEANTPLFPYHASAAQVGLPADQVTMDAYLSGIFTTLTQWVSASMRSGSSV